MEQFLDYYHFSTFKLDQSLFFDLIAYTHIKEDLYLLIEKKESTMNIHFTSYDHQTDIGVIQPNGLNTLIEDFKLDNNQHRKIVQQYLDYN